MDLSNTEHISQQLPSVITLLDTAFSGKAARKSQIHISTANDLSKDSYKKTFMFPSDLIFGRLQDNFGKKSDLGQVSQPVVSAKPEKGLGLPKTSSEPESSRSRRKKAKVQDRTKMTRLVSENVRVDDKLINSELQLPTPLYGDFAGSLLVKSESVDEVDSRSDNAKNFSIERILGKEEQTRLLENHQLQLQEEIKEERNSPKTQPANNESKNKQSEQTYKLPNISQFFEPVDNMKFEGCTVAKCEIGKSSSGNFTWLTGENAVWSFPTTPLKDFPLLRNTGRLEFNRSTLSVLQDDSNNQITDTKTAQNTENMMEIVEDSKGETNEKDSEEDECPSPPPQQRQQQQVSHSKGFRCEKCGKIYCRKYVLKIHMRTHSGEKPLKCEVCGKSFSDPSNMKKHVKLHETDHVTYPCKFCGRNFVRRRGLLNHLHSMHSRFPFIHPQI